MNLQYFRDGTQYTHFPHKPFPHCRWFRIYFIYDKVSTRSQLFNDIWQYLLVFKVTRFAIKYISIALRRQVVTRELHARIITTYNRRFKIRLIIFQKMKLTLNVQNNILGAVKLFIMTIPHTIPHACGYHMY